MDLTRTHQYSKVIFGSCSLRNIANDVLTKIGQNWAVLKVLEKEQIGVRTFDFFVSFR